jgi:hypothetical protein
MPSALTATRAATGEDMALALLSLSKDEPVEG